MKKTIAIFDKEFKTFFYIPWLIAEDLEIL